MSKKRSNENFEVTPHDAMLELFNRTGALKGKMTDRGAKFIHYLFVESGVKLRDGAVNMIREGKDVRSYMSPEGRRSLDIKRKKMKMYNNDGLKAIARRNEIYSRLIPRVFK